MTDNSNASQPKPQRHPDTTTCRSNWINQINAGTPDESWHCTEHRAPVWPNRLKTKPTQAEDGDELEKLNALVPGLMLSQRQKILALKSTWQAEARREMLEKLPEKLNYNDETVPKYLKPKEGEDWAEALRHEQGFNEAIDTFRKVIEDDMQS